MSVDPQKVTEDIFERCNKTMEEVRAFNKKWEDMKQDFDKRMQEALMIAFSGLVVNHSPLTKEQEDAVLHYNCTMEAIASNIKKSKCMTQEFKKFVHFVTIVLF